MPKHRESRVLPYSAAQMYDLVAAIERYPEFLPWCKSARVTARGEGRVVADLVVGTRLFHETFTSEVTLDKNRAIEVTYCSGPMSRLSNAWGFEAKGRKSCEVSFFVDFDFKSPLLRAAINVFFETALKKMVSAFEARAQALYG